MIKARMMTMTNMMTELCELETIEEQDLEEQKTGRMHQAQELELIPIFQASW